MAVKAAEHKVGVVEAHTLQFQLELDLAAVMIGYNIPRPQARQLAKQVVTQAANNNIFRRQNWNWNSGRP